MGLDSHLPHNVSSNGLCEVPVEIYGGETFPLSRASDYYKPSQTLQHLEVSRRFRYACSEG